MTSITADDGGEAILKRSQAALEASRVQLKPQLLHYCAAALYALFVLGACGSEFWSATVGFHAAFPTKSDGTSLAKDLMSLRGPIIFCLLAGDAVLHALPNRLKRILDWLTHSVSIGALLMLLFGVGGFMLLATLLNLGTVGVQGFAGRFIGLSLGVASASMFSLSFLTSHALMGRLFIVLPVIAAARKERRRIAAGDALLAQADTLKARIDGLRASVTEMEQPDALAKKAATEAGVIVGMVQSKAHDLVASRKVRGDTSLEPGDHSSLPDVPLAALEQRLKDLEPYTYERFVNLLKKEA